MSEDDDFSAPLTAEILSDVATRFFDARRELERSVELFDTLAAHLLEKRETVIRRAGALNFLLLQGKGARAFYHDLKVEEPGLLLAPPELPDNPPPRVPMMIGGGRRYARMVLETYGVLQMACEDYLGGIPGTGSETASDLRTTASYRVLESLCREINQRIARAELGMTPTDTLQFARRLTVGMSHTISESAVAPLAGYAQRLEEQLAYKPIDFEALGLPPLPRLPPSNTARGVIVSFCQDLYRHERPRIQAIITKIKGRARHAAAAIAPPPDT